MSPLVPPRHAARLVACGLAAITAVSLVGLGAGAADASTPKPAVPTGLKVASATRSSFTVTLRAAAHARTYRLYTSTLKSDLYQAAMGSSTTRRSFATATGPRVTVTGLRYTTAPYYYRVLVTNGTRSTWSDVSTSGARLAPAAPTSPSVASGAQGAAVLHWHSGAATAYTVQQSLSSSFTSGVRNYSTRGTSLQFTPFDLQRGATYYFRVRALNSGTPSTFSAPVSATTRTGQQDLRVLTYNLRSTNIPHDAAPWSKRLPGVLSSIRAASPDVVGTQESGARIHDTTRMVDSVASGLSGYRVADTDSDTDQQGKIVRSTGNKIVYRRSSVTPLKTGGQWDIGSGCTAAYTAFRTAGGARFLFVSTHLTAGKGSHNEALRKSQTQDMIAKARSYAGRLGLSSIIYVGDFNSYAGQWHNVDTPGAAMRDAGVTDAKLAAQHLYNNRFSSVNNYQRMAPTTGGAADHVFVQSGIGVRSWGEVLHVSHGKFVGVIPSDHNAVWSTLALPVAG